jgi:FlaG/FlaF family flagellin (archaellin)
VLPHWNPEEAMSAFGPLIAVVGIVAIVVAFNIVAST